MQYASLTQLVEPTRPMSATPTEAAVEGKADQIAHRGLEDVLIVFERTDGYLEAADAALEIRALGRLEADGRLPWGLEEAVPVVVYQIAEHARRAASVKVLHQQRGPVATALCAQQVLRAADLRALESSRLGDGRSRGAQHQPSYSAYLKSTGAVRSDQGAAELVHRSYVPEEVLRERLDDDTVKAADLTLVGRNLRYDQPDDPVAAARDLLAAPETLKRGGKRKSRSTQASESERDSAIQSDTADEADTSGADSSTSSEERAAASDQVGDRADSLDDEAVRMGDKLARLPRGQAKWFLEAVIERANLPCTLSWHDGDAGYDDEREVFGDRRVADDDTELRETDTSLVT